ncbi:hypothetical protein PYCC9005_005628 [Savitreella phatthalungensis]
MSGDVVPVRVAVVGSGLAGLATVHFLKTRCPASGPPIHVTLFEREGCTGMDSQSLKIRHHQNTSYTLVHGPRPTSAQPLAPRPDDIVVDVPMRSLAAGYYTKLIKLLHDVGIQSTNRPYTYAFATAPSTTPKSTGDVSSSDTEEGGVYATYGGGGGLGGFDLRMGWWEGVAVVWGFVVYLVVSSVVTWFGVGEGMSHERLCRRVGVPGVFRHKFLDPTLAAVCTCTTSQLAQYPASELLAYRARTAFRPHCTTDVAALVKRLAAAADRIHLNTNVHVPLTDDEVVTLQYTRNPDTDPDHAHKQTFDHVVLAFPPPDRVPTCMTSVVTHVVGRSGGRFFSGWGDDRREINLVSAVSADRGEGYAVASHVLHEADGEMLVQTTLPTAYVDTWFPEGEPSWLSRSDFVRARHDVNHPIIPPTPHKHNRIHHAGSYLVPGIPLLEGCVWSGERVADAILSHTAAITSDN